MADNITGFIYKTTNLINDKIYIGKCCNKRKNKRDNYIGSGLLLKKAIEKYGRANFKREILINDVPLNEIDSAEIKYIDYYRSSLGELQVYNIQNGGEGGGGNSSHKPDCSCNFCLNDRGVPHKIGCACGSCRARRGEKSGMNNNWYGKNLKLWVSHSTSPKSKQILRKDLQGYLLKGWVISRKDFTGTNNPNFNKNKGIDNPMYGVLKYWVTNPLTNETKLIDRDILTDYMSRGWVKGRGEKCHLRGTPPPNAGKVSINKNGKIVYCLPDDLNKFLLEGWRKGMK